MSAAEKPSENGSKKIFHLQQAFKLALSLVLFYWLALSTNWDLPHYGALAIVIVSLGTTGASVETGIMRVVGTTAGVAIGFLILALFSGDRWATMCAFSIHLVVMGYFMQTSRYAYAWYAAAFIPLVVWGDNYPQFGSAFYFGTFRWLETTAGILIYTMVDLVLWPRQAGSQLAPLGREFFALVEEQFSDCRKLMEAGDRPDSASAASSKLDGTLSRTVTTLQQAYLDTPTIGNQRRVWEDWRLNARGLVEALEIWSESIRDCQGMNLERLMPSLAAALNLLDRRFDRSAVLWDSVLSNGNVPTPDDGDLLKELSLELNHSACKELSHFQRAALMSFLGQLQLVDRASRELFNTMHTLAGNEPQRSSTVATYFRETYRPSAWDPARLIHALFPATVFIAGFFFWILVNPPGGAKVAMIAAVLALVVLRTPMNPVPLWLLLVLSTVFAVAPIYWLVMPSLSTGFELLSLIFFYSFFFGFLGGKSPALKSGPIIQFVMSAGISNQQNYSFQALVTGALMTILAGAIMTVVYFCFRPMHPERELLNTLRRFFGGCALTIGAFPVARPTPRDEGKRRRKRYLQSMVLPAPAQIQVAGQQLDYQRFPDNDSDTVQRLYDCVQSIANRMRSLEIAHGRIPTQSTELPATLSPLYRELRETAQSVFERWARFDPEDIIGQQQDSLRQLTRDFEQRLDQLEADVASESVLRDLYTLLGVVRGLFTAMANAQIVIKQINWSQWSGTQF